MKTKCAVIATNFRNLENWLPFFELLQTNEHKIEYFLLPFVGDPSYIKLSDLKSQAKFYCEIKTLSQTDFSQLELKNLCQRLVEDKFDSVFLCDVQSYPSMAVWDCLHTFKTFPKVIGLQHGLHQSWWIYNSKKIFDYLFVFGEEHKRLLETEIQKNTFVVGLPKLDLLVNKTTSVEGDAILFLPQKKYMSEFLIEILEDVKKLFQKPIILKQHPQYPNEYKITNTVVFSEKPTLELIAKSFFVLTFHSTVVLEACYLKRPSILLPSPGLVAFAQYPGVAQDFSAIEILNALKRFYKFPNEVNKFLNQVVGGIRFDHSQRAFDAYKTICKNFN